MTNNIHIKTIQNAITLPNKYNHNNSSAINNKQFKVMQANSKKLKPRTNKHKSKQDKLRDSEQDDQEEDPTRLKIGGAPKDYDDNLTYHEDSLSIFRGTSKVPGTENSRGTSTNQETQRLLLWVTVDYGAMTQLADMKFAEQSSIETEPFLRDKNLKGKPPWWLVRGRPPDVDQYDLEFKNKLRLNVRVRQLLEVVECEIGQRFSLIRKSVCEFESTNKKETYRIPMRLLEKCEEPYVIKDKVSPVVCVTNIDGEVEHIVNMKPF